MPTIYEKGDAHKIYQDEDGLYFVDYTINSWHKIDMMKCMLKKFRTYDEAMKHLEFLNEPIDHLDINEIIESVIEFGQIHPGVKNGQNS